MVGVTFSPYDPGQFERFAVTVDAAVFTIQSGGLHVVLVRRGEDPFLGQWALPGGFVRAGEDLDQAVARELAEETGLWRDGDWYLEQLGSYGTPDRDPRMRVVTVAYFAVAAALPALQGGGDAALAELRPVESIDPENLAFDHARIIHDALERIRSLLEYTTFGTRFLEPVFTTSELREVYETVWGIRVDQGNFRRNIGKNTCFVSLGHSDGRPGMRQGPGRPASLWSVKEAARRNHPGSLLARALASRDRGGALLGIRTRRFTEADSPVGD